MDINEKKLQSTTRTLHAAISIALCIFLILLTNTIISDLDKTIATPVYESYVDSVALGKVLDKKTAVEIDINKQYDKKTNIEKTMEIARANYVNEKQSFDNWIATRNTLGAPKEDAEVLERAKKLDSYYNVEQAWRDELQSISEEISKLDKRLIAIEAQVQEQYAASQDKYNESYKSYSIKVFLIRLLFVAPILALGIFFFFRFRRNTYWPLYFGFTLFSLYAFFIGLVPYLPSYGGYIRYSVGVLITLIAGYYAIKKIKIYIENKKAELKTSTSERAKKVQSETAELALQKHFCPSCGKDFLMHNWEGIKGVTKITEYTKATSFCRHCGLELFAECKACNARNFVHLPFCNSCGAKTNQQV